MIRNAAPSIGGASDSCSASSARAPSASTSARSSLTAGSASPRSHRDTVDACTATVSARDCCVRPASSRRSVNQFAKVTRGGGGGGVGKDGDDMRIKLGKFDEFGNTSISPSLSVVGHGAHLHLRLAQGT
jgi:hypothetical protein